MCHCGVQTEAVAGGVHLLGPIELVGPGGRADLVGARQRTLIGLLALEAGAVLPRSRIIDALWGDRPPRTAIKTLYSHVVRIRQALDECGLADVLITRDPGYALHLPRQRVDAWIFEEHVRQGRQARESGDWARATAELRAGLRLWRGDAFADGEPEGWGAAEVDRLSEIRLCAYEDVCTAELALGNHRAVLTEVERLLVRHPLRERLVELLMLALYRSGRHTDAIDTYHRLRARLADELGIDPGPDLQRLYPLMLRRDPSLDATTPVIVSPAPAPAWAPVPAQLPRRVGHFTGRQSELDDLDVLLDGDADEPRIVVISGSAGMGKTALAVQWAHQVMRMFPDGQLFLDLGGQDPTDALRHLLLGLGVPADRVPVGLSDQVSLYRSLLAGRALLIVLDNARSAEQILPLVPGDEASLLVITSRHRLAGLATHHAVRLVRLDTLPEDEALSLLGRVLGAARVKEEPDAAAGIVRLCGRMPLALRIAAAKVAIEPGRSLADMEALLSQQDRLETLAVEGDTRSVRTVFATAYQSLSQPAAAVFRRFGLHPGTSLAAPHLAGALIGEPPAVAGRLVDELASNHLLVELGHGRYRLHDLLRLYAEQRCQHEDSDHERAQAIERILDWYLSIATMANSTLHPGRNRVSPTLRFPVAELPFGNSRDDLLRFLDAERDNMVAVVRCAADQGHDTIAWQLTYLLASYFEFRGHWSDRVEICRCGLQAAQRVGDRFAQALMHSSLGVAYCEVHRFDDALEHLHESLALSHDSGDRRSQGTAHNNIAVALTGLGKLPEAAAAFGRALAVHSASDHPLGIALALTNIGDIKGRLGDTQSSLDHLDRALDMIRTIGIPRFEGVIRDNIGQTLMRAGAPDQALPHFVEALDIRREIGDRRYAADTLNHLGLAQLRTGDPRRALHSLREAVGISREIADPHLEAVALNNLAQAYLTSGDLAAAREHLSLAAALRARIPDADEEANLRRSLDDLAARSRN
jgi:DNA-binding SARP family transcriptional activator/tetratricopeptide (TPR) repeat protein